MILLIILVIPLFHLTYKIWFTEQTAFNIGLQWQAWMMGYSIDVVRVGQAAACVESHNWTWKNAGTWREGNNPIGMNHPSKRETTSRGSVASITDPVSGSPQGPAKYWNFFGAGRDFILRWDYFGLPKSLTDGFIEEEGEVIREGIKKMKQTGYFEGSEATYRQLANRYDKEYNFPHRSLSNHFIGYALFLVPAVVFVQYTKSAMKLPKWLKLAQKTKFK